MRLGQRIGAFHLQRVLRRQHKEGRIQVIAPPGNRDRLLLHRFQHRRLRLGRRPIDLIGEHQIGEYRTGLKAEFAPPVFRLF